MNIAARSMTTDVHAPDGPGVDRQRLETLFQLAPVALLTNFLIALVTAAALWPHVAPAFLAAWLLLSLITVVARLWLLAYLKRQALDEMTGLELMRHENAHAGGALLGGAVWGLLGWAFSETLPTSHQLLIPFVIGGMAAGALFSHLSSVRCYAAFAVPMVLPLSAGMYVSGMPMEAAMTMVYLGAILLLVLNLNRRFVQMLALRTENRHLVRHLSEVNAMQSALVDKLQEKERFLRHAFEDAGVAMLLVDPNWRIFDVNRAACTLFGYPRQQLVASRLERLLHRDEPHDLGVNFQQMLEGGLDHYSSTNRFLAREGRPLWLTSTLSAVRDEQGVLEYIVLQSQDITEQYLLSWNLQYQTLHDAVTGLPNRVALENRLNTLLQQYDSGQHALCYIDLDQFKVVNDICGHVAGDVLLKEVGELLQSRLAATDMLARFSGDEFAILMMQLPVAAAVDRVDGLLEAIRDYRFSFKENSFTISASIGLAPFDHHSSMTALLMQADSACHMAKEAGRDRLHVYSDSDEALLRHTGEMQWVQRIQQALSQQQFELHSQPIVVLDGEAAGQSSRHCELLIRMRDGDALIPPGDFLPAAERYNLAAAIDAWTVETVLERLLDAVAAGRDIAGIYGINLSGQSLGDARFYDRIIRLIAQHDLSGTGAVLCFEITETAAISNMVAALRFITEMRKAGCLFALDDFGSGLSSFAYLKQLPVDYLKIDGQFVRDCTGNSINLEIIRAIRGIGQVMGIKTVAEFVEDDLTMRQLQKLGVDFAQGYGPGRPSPWQP